MRICVLQAGSPPEALRRRFPGYGQMFEELLSEPGQAWDVFPVEKGDFPIDPLSYDRFVITGSRNSVHDEHDWIRALMELIRRVVRHARPVLAVCFGHQAVSHALGGEVIQNPLGWDAGIRSVALTGEAAGLKMTAGLPNPYRILESHRDVVARPPRGSLHLARSDMTRYEMLLVGGAALCLQGHPEFSNEFVQAIVADRRDRNVLSAACALEARRSLKATADRAPLRAFLRAFLRAGCLE